MRPIGIDLFAGAGGMSLGFEQAGFDVVAAVEIDPIHAAIHERNFPNCKTICDSVANVTAESLRDQAKIGQRVVDVVFGGAPCQGFSLIGQRAIDDPRNSLVREFVRIVSELNARYFVFENVKGITVGKHRRFLDELIELFELAGYNVVTSWKVLNAANYGVPQDRQRLFLMGCRKSEVLPIYPIATSTRVSARSEEDADLASTPTCSDALSDIPDAEVFEGLIESDSIGVNWGTPSQYAKELRGLTNDADHLGYKRQWNPKLLTSSRRTDHTEASRIRFQRTQPGSVEPISRFFKLAPDGVSNTLRAGTDSQRGAFTSPRPIHYAYPRCITVREMGRLHGYPDWFRFHVTKWHGARQVGNSVPPPLARAVAGTLVKAMGLTITPPGVSLRLGSDALLSFDMEAAARHFQVSRNVIPQRQRVEKQETAPSETISS